ncbi:MAG: hypothetical protein ACFCVK_02290 [Acidimicrobiales bacterium]
METTDHFRALASSKRDQSFEHIRHGSRALADLAVTAAPAAAPIVRVFVVDRKVDRLALASSTEPDDEAVPFLWQPGRGVLGVCWSGRRTVVLDTTDDIYRDATTSDFLWNRLSDDRRLGLTRDEAATLGPWTRAVTAVAVTCRTGALAARPRPPIVGVVAVHVDGDAHDDVQTGARRAIEDGALALEPWLTAVWQLS